jgi:hypothetical protein
VYKSYIGIKKYRLLLFVLFEDENELKDVNLTHKQTRTALPLESEDCHSGKLSTGYEIRFK